MVSGRESFHQDQHKGNGKNPIQESQWINHGVSEHHASTCSIGLRNVINGLGTTNSHESILETFFRRVVREEVERKVHDHLFSRARVNVNNNEVGNGISGVKPLELCFTNKVPHTIFTQSNVIGEDESPIKIALIDVRSRSIVNDGPLSSIKVEICALDGDFGSHGSDDDWTQIEFNANILRERDGKEPLLVGERFIALKNGVGCINKINFTDNSRWLRSRKFRLGAKVVQPIPINGENIKEGRSESFVVKDNRGESYKKHYPPYLNDEIWRLVKIAKQGKIHERLSLKGIHTVKDLLKLLIINGSNSLHENKFSSIPRRSWLAIIEHAKSCVIDDYKLYGYHTIGQPLLLFNAIYQLVGVTIDGQNYYSPDTLSPSQKHLVEIIKQDAYKNVDNLESIDEALLNSISLAACLNQPGVPQSKSPVQDLQYTDTSTAQGQNEIFPAGYIQPSIPASYIDEGMYNCQIDPDIREILQNSSLVGDEMYNIEGDGYGSHFPVVQGGGYSTENENIEFLYGCPSYTMEELDNDFSFDRGEFDVDILISDMDISSSGKPKAVWCKILAALKWVISVKRHATARKHAELFYCNN